MSENHRFVVSKSIGTAVSALMVISLPTCAASPPAATLRAGWQTLIAVDRVTGLRGWTATGLPNGWTVQGGILSKDGAVEDLATDQTFGDFELELEWKIGKGGNSGIFYRGTREYDRIYWSGPEYQLLDDANAPDAQTQLTSSAANYGLYAATPGVVRPADRWNTTRIVVTGKHVEHWLNGRKVVHYELESADWRARVAASKFAAYPRYGLATQGLIGIQGDHPGSLAIRHLRVRALP